MKILILGAGKMGSFFTDLLSFDHEVAVLEKDPKRMRFIYNALRLQSPEEVKDFNGNGEIDSEDRELRDVKLHDRGFQGRNALLAAILYYFRYRFREDLFEGVL